MNFNEIFINNEVNYNLDDKYTGKFVEQDNDSVE